MRYTSRSAASVWPLHPQRPCWRHLPPARRQQPRQGLRWRQESGFSLSDLLQDVRGGSRSGCFLSPCRRPDREPVYSKPCANCTRGSDGWKSCFALGRTVPPYRRRLALNKQRFRACGESTANSVTRRPWLRATRRSCDTSPPWRRRATPPTPSCRRRGGSGYPGADDQGAGPAK